MPDMQETSDPTLPCAELASNFQLINDMFKGPEPLPEVRETSNVSRKEAAIARNIMVAWPSDVQC